MERKKSKAAYEELRLNPEFRRVESILKDRMYKLNPSLTKIQFRRKLVKAYLNQEY